MKPRQSRWEKYAADNKLTLKLEGGEKIAIGKLGTIYEYSDDEVGAMYSPEVPLSKKGWRVFREKMVAVGAEITQFGDLEGAVKFTYENAKALRTACKILKVPNKRTLSPERRAAAAARFAAYRASQ